MATEILKFYATWCRPCTAMAPVVSLVASELGLSVDSIDIDDNPDIAQDWAVRSIPTLIVVRDGKEIYRHVGAASYETLKTKLTEAL